MSRNRTDERFWNRPKGSSWGKANHTRNHLIPAHLKGKQIGLYFKEQGKTFKQFKREVKKEHLVTLKIPPAVETKVYTNLQSIAEIAQRLNISIPQIAHPDSFNKREESIVPTSSKSDNEVIEWSANTTDENNIKWTPNDENSDVDCQIIKDVFKKPNAPKPKSQHDYTESQPGSSSAADFIPIGNEEQSEYGSSYGIPSLRGGGDYKYGYEDIITGTFDEKLEESLSKGVSINTICSNIKSLNASFLEEYQEMVSRTGYRRLLHFREKLPTFKKAREVLNVIRNHQVVVISGETGCGKSTQVPQQILDDAICSNRGANVKVIVTQPRRIAASSLAARVAEERAERMGNTVGYAVRLEKVDARSRGSIMFCTTGVLLADLEVNQGLTEYSHVILDEVHERDCHVDLSMCMLKKVLKRRKDLKLILMSATLDAEALSSYFDNCPMMHIEGLAYPVHDIYLEEILHMTQFQLEEPVQKNKPKWMKHRKNKQFSKANLMEQAIKYRAEIGPWLESVKHNLDRGVYLTLQDNRIEELNIDLIFALLLHICRGPPGAILVFLPGIGPITKLMRIMEESNMFPRSFYEIYPLHSKLPSLEQHKIFERPPGHIRKIIIATNIAETSITIDDIVYVVDCGKIKLSGLNVEDNVATLRTEWVSQANLHQRRGRAGRCQPGICYHLVTSYRAGTLLERHLPELQRSNLLEPVLTIKRLRLGLAADALNEVPSPPAESTVQWAVKHLQQCGALNDKETLTPLGWHLARLPVHPSAGKLLLLGALFGCLDRAASVAAVWGFKDPFQLVIGKEREVDEAKRYLAQGEPSDQIAISEAIIQWEQCPQNRRRSFAYEHFISNNTVELLSDMKNQLGDSLKQMGFLPSGDVRSAWENRNSNNLSLFKAIVAASLYPNIAFVRWTNLYSRKKQMRISVRTPEESRPVSVHPGSVMSVTYRSGNHVPLCSNPGANWLVYWLKQMSTDLYLIEVTLVYTLPLLFFGELRVTAEEDENNKDECMMAISTIKVRCKKETANLLFALRSLLDQVLASKVMVSNNLTNRHCDFEECVLNAVIELITAEDERADCLGDDDQSESDSYSESEASRNSQWH